MHKIISVFVSLVLISGYGHAQGSQVSNDVERVKQTVLQLNRDLYQLEEDLLSPATTRVNLYFVLKGGELFEPLSLDLTVDNKRSVQHLYTEKQVGALRRGAIQPLTNLNLGPGEHTIKAVISGVNQDGDERTLVTEKRFEKNDQPVYLELTVVDNKEKDSAELIVSQW